MQKRTVEEETLRQLQIINSQLDPGPALMKFFLLIFAIFICRFRLVRVVDATRGASRTTHFQGNVAFVPLSTSASSQKGP